MISVSSLVILRCNDSFLEVKHPLSIRPQASPLFKQEEAVMQGSSRTPEPLQPKAPQLIWVLLQEQSGWTKAGPISRVPHGCPIPSSSMWYVFFCPQSDVLPQSHSRALLPPSAKQRDFFSTSAAQAGWFACDGLALAHTFLCWYCVIIASNVEGLIFIFLHHCGTAYWSSAMQTPKAPLLILLSWCCLLKPFVIYDQAFFCMQTYIQTASHFTSVRLAFGEE